MASTAESAMPTRVVGGVYPARVFAPSAAGGGKAPWQAVILGSATSGIVEQFLFHPVDTVAKRLMSDKSSGANKKTVSEIVFREHAHASMGRRFTSLFPGLGYAAGYKVLQRTYKFGAQRFMKDYLSRNHKPAFTGLFGDQHGVNMMHACAGSLVGAGEVALLPLDVLKIKSQTNPEVLAGRGLVQLVSQERFALYRGWEWTIARNMPGSFSLFGGAALVKGSVFGLEDYSKATFFQNFVSSIGGAVASISVASPTDVIKTRIQNQAFDEHKGGVAIIRDLLRNEGPGALFKGLTPKIIVVGPKLVFSFTIAQTLISVLGDMMNKQK